MFQFSRQLILPLFLQKRMPISRLAEKAGVSYSAAEKAIQGRRISAAVVDKISTALGIDTMAFLEPKVSVSY